MPIQPIAQHNRMLMSVAGAACAFVAVASLHGAAVSNGLAAPPAILQLFVAVVTFAAFYQFQLLLSARQISFMLGRAAWLWLRVCLVVGLGYFLLPEVALQFSRWTLVEGMAIELPALLVILALMRIFALYLYSSRRQLRSAIMIDPGPQARLLSERLARSPILGMHVAGYFGTAPAGQDAPSRALPYLGSLDDAIARIADNRYQVVFLDSGLLASPQAAVVLHRLGDATASIYVIPEPPSGYRISGVELAGLPMLALHETGIIGLARLLKRSMDVVLSALGILFLSPLLALIALGVRLSSPGPILFRQQRAGEGNRPIEVYKFRTMYVHSDDGVRQATRDDPRVTRFGRLLRRSSLDELPQLFNVLGGSMSLVGPRPHAVEHNERYRRLIDGYMLRYTVKPGITGWAQVNGLRGETDTIDKMRERVEYDRYYIQNWSPWLDITILWRTIWILVRDKAAY